MKSPWQCRVANTPSTPVTAPHGHRTETLLPMSDSGQEIVIVDLSIGLVMLICSTVQPSLGEDIMSVKVNI